MSYQKKNLEKKFASSTGDFCILSAPPVWFLCTWVVCVRVAHICGSPEWLRSHRQAEGARLGYPPLCASGKCDITVTFSSFSPKPRLVSPWSSLVPLALSAPVVLLSRSVRQWEDSPSFMGSPKLAETHVISTPMSLRLRIVATSWRGKASWSEWGHFSGLILIHIQHQATLGTMGVQSSIWNISCT